MIRIRYHLLRIAKLRNNKLIMYSKQAYVLWIFVLTEWVVGEDQLGNMYNVLFVGQVIAAEKHFIYLTKKSGDVQNLSKYYTCPHNHNVSKPDA